MPININITRILNKLRNDEHVGVGQASIDHIKEDVGDIPLAQADWDRYEMLVPLELVMYRQSPESPETKEIAAFDVQRGRYWIEMLHRLRFSERSSDEDVRKAAGQLLFIMKKYGNVSNANLFGETATMRKALMELKAAENNAATALINGFNELIAEAEMLNETVHTLYDKRLKDKEDIKELGKLVDFRKVIDKRFITFLETVNAIDRVNELGAKDPAIKAAAERIRVKLSALIAQLQLILSRRKLRVES